MSEQIVFTARALIRGLIPETSFGPDVQIALRGYRRGLVRQREFLNLLAEISRQDRLAMPRFDRRGNLLKA